MHSARVNTRRGSAREFPPIRDPAPRERGFNYAGPFNNLISPPIMKCALNGPARRVTQRRGGSPRSISVIICRPSTPGRPAQNKPQSRAEITSPAGTAKNSGGRARARRFRLHRSANCPGAAAPPAGRKKPPGRGQVAAFTRRIKAGPRKTLTNRGFAWRFTAAERGAGSTRGRRLIWRAVYAARRVIEFARVAGVGLGGFGSGLGDLRCGRNFSFARGFGLAGNSVYGI